MKKLLILSLMLISSTTWADTYRWSCSTLNFLAGNVENASTKDVVYTLNSDDIRKEFILSESSNVKIKLAQGGYGIDLAVYDSQSGTHLGGAAAGIEGRTLTLYPVNTGKGFSWVNCSNLDFVK